MRVAFALAFVAAACSCAAAGDDDRPYFAVAAQDTAVKGPCGARCGASGPLDTVRWLGFGPFASLPPSLGECGPARRGIDTLRYGALETDPQTGERSGTQFVFQRVVDSIRGHQVEGRGGPSRPIALLQLEHPDGTDSLAFWTTDGGRAKYEHRVELTCDRIEGVFRAVEVTTGQEPESVGAYETFSLERSR